jgi:hypothetical protein
MNSVITSKDAVKIAANKVSQHRWFILLSLGVALLVAPFQRFMAITGAKESWSPLQLWLSIRDNYFSTNPLLYIFQADNNNDASWGLFIFGVVATFFIVIIVLSVVVGIVRLVKSRSLQYGSALESYAHVAGNVAIMLPENDKKREFQTWDFAVQGHGFVFAARDTTIVLSTTLSTHLPHIVLDSTHNKNKLSSFMNKADEFVVDGVMYEHFKIFAAEKDPVMLLTLFNPVLCDTLVKYGNFADIQIKDRSLVMTLDAKTVKKQQYPDEFFAGLAEIAKLFNEQAVRLAITSETTLTMNKRTKLMDTLFFRKFSPLVRILYPLVIFVVLAKLIPTLRVEENLFIALATLFGLLMTWVYARFLKRRLV